MLYKTLGSIATVLLGLTAVQVWAQGIPDAEVDIRLIYVGNPTTFSSPAEVDYNAVVHQTEEYAEILEEKLERGSGKYWILLSQASDKALGAIARTASRQNYDLVAEKGYLGSLNEPVDCPDITQAVIEQLD